MDHVSVCISEFYPLKPPFRNRGFSSHVADYQKVHQFLTSNIEEVTRPAAPHRRGAEILKAIGQKERGTTLRQSHAQQLPRHIDPAGLVQVVRRLGIDAEGDFRI